MGGSGSKSSYTLEQSSASNGASNEETAATSNKNSNKKSDGNFAECIVCPSEEMKDGEMREVEVGGGKALLVKDNGEYHAIGPKCTHYGAPLIKGVVANGHVRCPWHGACFNIRTGDIEDFPGLDSIQKFDVEIEDGKVKVIASKKKLQTQKRVREMCCESPDEEKTFLIIGGGGASLSCAETLRQEGFKGKIIIATKENCLPYDRPKLSKALNSTADALALRDKDFYAVYDIEVQINKEAVSVDSMLNTVTFKDGESINFDKLLIATGGSPRSLSLPGSDLENVCVLRSPDDANRIASQAAGKHVVIIGTSFIGMEAAAYLADQAASVTCLDILDIPFKMVLGDTVGLVLKKLHEAKGTKFIAKNSPKEFIGENGKLKEVVLSDETRLPADICIMGIGVFPTTAFLKDSGIDMNERGFVTVDKTMKTSKDNIYAGGDIVTFPLFLVDNEQANVQHWQMSHAHGRIAGQNMLEQNVEIHSVPFFWTMQFGKSLRYAGYGMGFDDVLVKGDLDEFKFVAYYTKGDKVIAVASMNMDPIVAQAAELMLAGKTIAKHEVSGEHHDGWLRKI